MRLIVYEKCLQRCIVMLSVPFAITARVGEGGALRECRLLWTDVRRAVRKDAVL